MMKRRPSKDLQTVRPTKRTTARLSNAKQTHHLLDILEQYGLLEAIVSNLSAADLLALILSSKALHQVIAYRPESLKNLLGKLSCSGKGVLLRTKYHKNSPFFFAYDCTEYVKCGSEEQGRFVDTKPCVNCEIATCDECRIHCVYQSICEASSDPDDPAELPNFSGFILLEPSEQPILSPHHLLADDSVQAPRWQNPSNGEAGPYHDQGYLDVALEEDSTAPPECVKDLLEMDLGLYSLTTLSASSFYDPPSPVVRSLCRITEARKVFLCQRCFDHDAPKGPESLHPPIICLPWLDQPMSTLVRKCHCTLRNRFLNRWLCVSCYMKEDEIISECTKSTPLGHETCRCGADADAGHFMCLWCWGEVQDTYKTVAETLRVTP